MMVFCLCMNDSVNLLQYILVYNSACGEANCDEILNVAFSFTICIIMVLVNMLKVQNRF